MNFIFDTFSKSIKKHVEKRPIQVPYAHATQVCFKGKRFVLASCHHVFNVPEIHLVVFSRPVPFFWSKKQGAIVFGVPFEVGFFQADVVDAGHVQRLAMANINATSAATSPDAV